MGRRSPRILQALQHHHLQHQHCQLRYKNFYYQHLFQTTASTSTQQHTPSTTTTATYFQFSIVSYWLHYRLNTCAIQVLDNHGRVYSNNTHYLSHSWSQPAPTVSTIITTTTICHYHHHNHHHPSLNHHHLLLSSSQPPPSVTIITITTITASLYHHHNQHLSLISSQPSQKTRDCGIGNPLSRPPIWEQS